MEASNHRRMEVMAAPRKYPDELRERAIRFALDLVDGAEKLSVNAACKRVGEQLGIVPDSLRNWVQRARLMDLERENRELRRANEILKSASAFFAAELDRPYRR